MGKCGKKNKKLKQFGLKTQQNMQRCAHLVQYKDHLTQCRIFDSLIENGIPTPVLHTEVLYSTLLSKTLLKPS